MTQQQPEPTSLALRPEPTPERGLSLVGDPQEAVDNAARAAKALMTIVHQGKISKKIGDKEYLFYEAWQTIAHFYGITVGCDRDEPVGDGQGWVAYATAYRQGNPVSHAIAQCTRAERMWSTREDFQLRSMAQTRACGKALRNVLAFVAVLGGYAPTPAEEMEPDAGAPTPQQAPYGLCECGEPFIKSENMTWPAHRAKDGKWHNKPKPAPSKPAPTDITPEELTTAAKALGYTNQGAIEVDLGMKFSDWLKTHTRAQALDKLREAWEQRQPKPESPQKEQA